MIALDLLCLLVLVVGAFLFQADLRRAFRGYRERQNMWADPIHKDHWGYTVVGALLALSLVICWVRILVLVVQKIIE